MEVKYIGRSRAVVWKDDERVEMVKGDVIELDRLPEGGGFEEVKKQKKSDKVKQGE